MLRKSTLAILTCVLKSLIQQDVRASVLDTTAIIQDQKQRHVIGLAESGNMRAKDFLTERKRRELRKSAQQSLPGGETMNTDFYGAYRFALSLAGSPDGVDMPEDGPTQGRMVTLAYTQGEQEIIDAAKKRMGVTTKHKLTKGEGSNELPDVNTQSITVAQGPVKRKNR